MSDEEIAKLETEVNKLKFKAGQKASELHDLIEDRLMTDFEEIPAFAEEAYAACKAWSDKLKELKQIKGV
ncbi:CCE_0567 family metalloprotein [Mangrovibacterium lignilyticum]|uniref:CCE_0567 family metalloprotein n=1 Tax=Mangrovibacterium lignilyticum TaxID=2668052 RepID=UPI0013D0E0FC|nr:CCE_0567 family metalloprotein [Mangrovibacterium lignilyticum]